MKILVTGSSGMLGSDLAEVLSRSFDVYGLSRHSQPTYSSRFTPILADLDNESELRDIFKKIKPDLVFHAAAFTKVDLCEDPQWKDLARSQNTEAVKRLTRLCNEAAAFLIFFSTDYVFSGQKKEPYVENDPIQPLNYYGQTKAWAEEALFSESKRFMIFRVTWLYGRNGNHFPKAILNQALSKNEIPVVADQIGRPTWTRDIACAFSELLITRQNLLDQYNKQIFHIGNQGQVNWSGYARYLLDCWGYSHVAVREISSDELKRPAKRPMNSVLSLDKARDCLGVRMRSWQEALADFIKGECSKVI